MAFIDPGRRNVKVPRYFRKAENVHPYKGTMVRYASGKGYYAGPRGPQRQKLLPPPGGPAPSSQPGSPPPATQPGPTPGGVTSPPDYTTDPMYAKALGAYQTRMGSAQGTRLADQKRLLLGFGSQEMARGLLGDDPFVGTVSSDPRSSFSTLANIARGHAEGVTDFEGQMGEQNLAFGSARVGGLTNLATQRLSQEAEQRRLVEEALRGVQGAFATEAGAAMDDLLASEGQAYTNALSSTAQAAEVEDPTGDTGALPPNPPVPNLVKPGAFNPKGKGFQYQGAARKALKKGQKLYYRGGRYYPGPK